MGEPRTFELTASDGLVLQGYRWEPAVAPRAIVQIAHGMSEHALRYRPLAETLAAVGYLVVAHDHRGHGASVRTDADRGHFADHGGWDLALADLHLVNRTIASEFPTLPIVVLGHSMGSFLVQNLAFAHPEDMTAVVLSGSNGKPPLLAQAGRVVARLERMRLGRRGRSTLLNKLSFEDFNSKFRPNRTDFDWLSRDERVVDAYILDPRCGFMVTVQTWIDMLDALPNLTEPTNLARGPKHRPVLCIAGDRDPVGLMGEGVRRLVKSLRAAGFTRVESKLYPGARHEVLHETNHEEVTRDLLAWLERALEPGSRVP